MAETPTWTASELSELEMVSSLSQAALYAPLTREELAAVREAMEPAGGIGMREHIVQSGDTLGRIALAHYGSMTEWPRIWAANEAAIRREHDRRYSSRRFNPYKTRPWDGIFPGTVLRIPEDALTDAALWQIIPERFDEGCGAGFDAQSGEFSCIDCGAKHPRDCLFNAWEKPAAN